LTLGPDFSKQNGLLPVIAQDSESGNVLMLAYMNEFAWNKTLETGKAHYWSRSRQKLWMKGEESGNVQLVRQISIDCDSDTILLKVEQLGGAACHTGFESCFHRLYQGGGFEVQGVRVFDPREVYKK
jgi:phosphoribosyl-AMP cyclohydrolase